MKVRDFRGFTIAIIFPLNVLQDPVVHKSMLCLKSSVSNLNNTYTTALMAYVFSLAGDMKTRDFLLQHLDTVASQQGESEDLNWDRPSGSVPVDPCDPPVCRGLSPLVPEHKRPVVLSVRGDQLLRSAGQAQQLSYY